MKSIMSSNNIDYNNPLPEYEGLKFYVDAFNARRRIYQIMPIFFEEQPLTWILYEKEIKEHLSDCSGKKVLDVGCGSGFWGLLIKKKFPQAEVICLDKNPVAIERARYNSLLNHLDISFIEGIYDPNLFNNKYFDLIILTPPYHLYDPINSEHIPLFARGGEYGLQEFYSQSDIAINHLKDNGMILFNQMSGGSNSPDYVRFYKETFGLGKLEYTNILPPISSLEFLEGVYGKLNSEYLIHYCELMPTLYYTSGIYRKNNQSFKAIENTENKIKYLSDLHENWQIRINLHKEINKF